MPPFLAAIEHMVAGSVVGYDYMPPMRDPSFALKVDFGEAGSAWQTWLNRELGEKERSQAGSVLGYDGFYAHGDPERQKRSGFIGFQGNEILAGAVPALTAVEESRPSRKISIWIHEYFCRWRHAFSTDERYR